MNFQKPDLLNNSFSSESNTETASEQAVPEAESETPAQSSADTANEAPEAIEASAGDVAGNIIERYISPYTAGSSYDGVYLKNSTGLDINIENLLNSPLSFSVEKNGEPQVLIIHTHATESFMSGNSPTYTTAFSSRTTDNEKNMVKIGDIVAEKLNKAGIATLHDATHHDYPKYNGSYTRAAETVTSYLKKYPSIKIVLDLHRDAISSGDSDKVKLTTEINGKKAAQVMLVMGSQSGGVTNFPDWQENLKLALRLQRVLEKSYPTLARPLSLMSKNYNESLTKGSMLIEFGTDANSLSEVHYSAELVGNCLCELLGKG